MLVDRRQHVAVHRLLSGFLALSVVVFVLASPAVAEAKPKGPAPTPTPTVRPTPRPTPTPTPRPGEDDPTLLGDADRGAQAPLATSEASSSLAGARTNTVLWWVALTAVAVALCSLFLLSQR